jgi:hypothetical protein
MVDALRNFTINFGPQHPAAHGIARGQVGDQAGTYTTIQPSEILAPISHRTDQECNLPAVSAADSFLTRFQGPSTLIRARHIIFG